MKVVNLIISSRPHIFKKKVRFTQKNISLFTLAILKQKYFQGEKRANKACFYLIEALCLFLASSASVLLIQAEEMQIREKLEQEKEKQITI